MSETYQSLSHSKWDFKYHVVFVPKRRRESHLRPNPSATGCDLPRAGSAKGVPDHRGTPDAGPCAHVHRDSTEAPSGIGDRFFERQERHRDRPLERQRAKLLRRAFLRHATSLNTPRVATLLNNASSTTPRGEATSRPRRGRRPLFPELKSRISSASTSTETRIMATTTDRTGSKRGRSSRVARE